MVHAGLRLFWYRQTVARAAFGDPASAMSESQRGLRAVAFSL
jgi:hypothetical protein